MTGADARTPQRYTKLVSHWKVKTLRLSNLQTVLKPSKGMLQHTPAFQIQIKSRSSECSLRVKKHPCLVMLGAAYMLS